jgi:transcriptional regulator with XRE-family HTH domain
MMLTMETRGKRIQKLREEKGWSLARAGKEIAIRAGRAEPFSGEVIRQYELDATWPSEDAVNGMALAFEREPAYILFGDGKKLKGASTDAERLYEKYLALSALDRQIVDLMLKKSGL